MFKRINTIKQLKIPHCVRGDVFIINQSTPVLACILYAVSLLGLAPAHAEDELPQYDFEIVIFEDQSNRYLNSEHWPRIEHALPAAEETTDPLIEMFQEKGDADSAGNNKVIDFNDHGRNMLDEYVKILDRSSRYRVLVHKSWRQVGLDADSAIDIEIHSNNQSTNDGDATASGNQAVEPVLTDEEAAQEKLESSISGTVKIVLGRYLHIYTDLIYRKPASPQSPIPVSLEDSRYNEFSIKTHRRMRSKELHYLDHPLVGMLVMALPVEKEENKKQLQP